MALYGREKSAKPAPSVPLPLFRKWTSAKQSAATKLYGPKKETPK